MKESQESPPDRYFRNKEINKTLKTEQLEYIQD